MIASKAALFSWSSAASLCRSLPLAAAISRNLTKFFSYSIDTAALYFWSLSLMANIFLMPALMTAPCLRCSSSAFRIRFRVFSSPSRAFFSRPKRCTFCSKSSAQFFSDACCSPLLPRQSVSSDRSSLACSSSSWSRLSRSMLTASTSLANSSSSACRLSLSRFSSFSQASSRLASSLARLLKSSSLPPLNLRSSSSQYFSRQHLFCLHSASAWSLRAMASSSTLSAFLRRFVSFSQWFLSSSILISSSFR